MSHGRGMLLAGVHAVVLPAARQPASTGPSLAPRIGRLLSSACLPMRHPEGCHRHCWQAAQSARQQQGHSWCVRMPTASAHSPLALPWAWRREAAAFSSNLRKAHALWAQLGAEVRATDLAAADAAGDTSLRACLARIRVSENCGAALPACHRRGMPLLRVQSPAFNRKLALKQGFKAPWRPHRGHMPSKCAL